MIDSLNSYLSDKRNLLSGWDLFLHFVSQTEDHLCVLNEGGGDVTQVTPGLLPWRWMQTERVTSAVLNLSRWVRVIITLSLWSSSLINVEYKYDWDTFGSGPAQTASGDPTRDLHRGGYKMKKVKPDFRICCWRFDGPALLPQVHRYKRSFNHKLNLIFSPSTKMFFFVTVAARFLKKCNRICKIFMQFYAMKLQEYAKIAVWWIRKKKWFPEHPVLTRLLPQCKESFRIAFYDKQAYYITGSAGNN